MHAMKQPLVGMELKFQNNRSIYFVSSSALECVCSGYLNSFTSQMIERMAAIQLKLISVNVCISMRQFRMHHRIDEIVQSNSNPLKWFVHCLHTKMCGRIWFANIRTARAGFLIFWAWNNCMFLGFVSNFRAFELQIVVDALDLMVYNANWIKTPPSSELHVQINGIAWILPFQIGIHNPTMPAEFMLFDGDFDFQRIQQKAHRSVSHEWIDCRIPQWHWFYCYRSI